MNLSVQITRTELGFGVLQINQDGIYKIIRDKFGPGEKTFRRKTTDSPWIAGRGLVAAVPDQMNATIGVRVLATNTADLHTRIRTLIEAFEQFSYQIIATIDGVTISDWTCEAADWTIGDGGQIQPFHIGAYQQEITFQVPHFPARGGGIA